MVFKNYLWFFSLINLFDFKNYYHYLNICSCYCSIDFKLKCFTELKGERLHYLNHILFDYFNFFDLNLIYSASSLSSLTYHFNWCLVKESSISKFICFSFEIDKARNAFDLLGLYNCYFLNSSFFQSEKFSCCQYFHLKNIQNFLVDLEFQISWWNLNFKYFIISKFSHWNAFYC